MLEIQANNVITWWILWSHDSWCKKCISTMRHTSWFIPAGYTSKLQVMGVGFNKDIQNNWKPVTLPCGIVDTGKLGRYVLPKDCKEYMEKSLYSTTSWCAYRINDVHISANEDIPTGIHQIEDVVPVQGKCTCSLDEEIDLLYYNDSGDLQLPVQQNRTIF